jgi:hypothetical protein
MGASLLAGKFPKAVYPPPFGNFRKHLTHLPSEISEKFREEITKISTGFDFLTS